MMSNKSSTAADREYIAFISYRHRPLDMEAARRIQKKIESFSVPRELRDRAGGKHLGMVFRDEDELPASASLTGSITYALDHSKYLLVICTPDLPQSQWCEQEIRYFLQTHDRDHVLAVLVDGEPQESFSPLLLHTYDELGNITGDAEPLAANIVGQNHSINNKAFRKEIVRIYAALLGCPFDALWQRQRRARTNRLMALMAAATAVMAVFVGVVFSKNRQITEQNLQITEQNEQITEQNEQIIEQNGEISRKNLELRQQMSSILVDAGRSQLESHDVLGAMQSALNALPEEEGQPFDQRAELLLADALCAYQADAIQSRLLYSQSTEIVDVAVTEDFSKALLADSVGYVRCISTQDGSLLWEAMSKERPEIEDAALDLLMVDAADLVICKNPKNVRALDLETGEPRWSYDYETGYASTFYCLSPDRGTLILREQGSYGDPAIRLIAIDTASGQELARVFLGDEEQPLSTYGSNFWYTFGGGFSDNGKYLAYVQELPAEEDENQGLFFCALVDTETWQPLNSILYKGSGSAPSPIILGLAVQNDNGNVFCAQYDTGYGGLMTVQIDWEAEKAVRNLTNKTLGSSSGLSLDVLIEQPFVPMLTSDSQAVVFVQESMFLFDLASGECRRGYAFQGSIVSARWENRDEEQLILFTGNGVYARYDLEHIDDHVIRSMSSNGLDQSDLILAQPLGTANMQELALTVPAGQQGQLLAVSYVSDPSAQRLPSAEGSYSSYYRAISSPSGEKVFLFYPKSGATTVVVCDAASGEELERTEIPDLLRNNPCVLDDDSFLVGCTIYHMDGSTQILEPLTEAFLEKLWYDSISSITLSDGQALTLVNYSGWNRTLLPCWLNDRLVDASQEVETGIVFANTPSMTLGANGFVIGYGICVVEEPEKPSETESSNSETPETSETPDESESSEDSVHPYIDTDELDLPVPEYAFYAFDARNGRHLLIHDPLPESVERNLALGSETPIMVYWNEQSNIVLISLTDGSVQTPGLVYLPGEILTMCFTPGDTHLAVLTHSGRLDIYELASGEIVFSDLPPLLRSVNVSYIHELRCQSDRSGERLLFSTDYIGNSYGCFFVFDKDSWNLLAQARDVYTYLAADDCVYVMRNSDMIRYPLHTLDDLSEMAQNELDGVS